MAHELRPVRWPALVAHVGLAMVAFSASYTRQMEGFFSRGEYAAFGLIGLAALIVALVWRGERARGTFAVGIGGLAAATALYLSYDPQLASLPGMSFIGMSPVGLLMPGLAHVGVLLAAIFVALQMAIDRRALQEDVPFRSATFAAAALVLALAGVMWLALHNIYDLAGTSGTAMLVFRVISYSVLMVVTMTLSGARGVGSLPQGLFGLSVLIAVARNLMG